MNKNKTRKLLIATHNQGKLREYRRILADLPIEVTDLKSEGITIDVEETGETFAENAALKASAYSLMTGLWTWADDSGLEVDPLDGRPGVYSARYAGAEATDEERCQHLLAELRPLSDIDWTARFQCVIAFARPLPTGQVQLESAAGNIEGIITPEPRGAEGFGYDPIFYIPEQQRTMAELEPELKNSISHRANAAVEAKRLLIASLSQ